MFTSARELETALAVEEIRAANPIPPDWTGWEEFWGGSDAGPTGWSLEGPGESLFILGTYDDAEGDWETPRPTGPVRLDFTTAHGWSEGTEFPDRDSARRAAEFARTCLALQTRN